MIERAIADLSQYMPSGSHDERVRQAWSALDGHVQRCFNGNYEEFRKQAGKYDYTLTAMQEYHRRLLGL
ncbi:hypothetical protein HY498_03985 [Candidatus Woesearchaeota archaeon]|nr:hypothetical protein [Candidatus Woesearchaeota archaeon]